VVNIEMILTIGFGSLMSHYGIHSQPSTRDIEIFNPFIVRLNGSRGFNTLKGHYMDIGSEFNPEGFQVDIDEAIDKSGNTIECLAFYIKNKTLPKIANREGYPTELMEEIKNLLDNYTQKDELQERKRKISEILWTFYPEQDISTSYHEKIYRYRKKLSDHIHYDIIKAHSYVPHPVKVLCKQKDMAIFGLISIHTDIGAKRDYNRDIRLMTIQEAVYSEKPPRKSYFKECILGGVHGINIRDLLSGMDINNGGMRHYLTNLKEDIENEWINTQDWNFHGNDLRKNLKRSGLLEYLPDL